MGIGSPIRPRNTSLEDGKERFKLLHGDTKAGRVINTDPMRLKVSLDVRGMTCSSCSGTIEKCLKDIKGVEHVSVSLMTERAEVVYRSKELSPAVLVEEIEDIGFEAKVRPDVSLGNCSAARLIVEGSLSGDAEKQIRVLIQREGIVSVTIGPKTEDTNMALLYVPGAVHREALSSRRRTMSSTSINRSLVELAPPKPTGLVTPCTIMFDPTLLGIRKISNMITEILDDEGIRVWLEISDSLESQQRAQQESKDRELRQWRRFFWTSLVFTIPVVVIGLFIRIIESWEAAMNERIFISFGLTWKALILFILATPVQFGPGSKFADSAIKSIRHGAASMDVLVALGSSVAYAYSVISIALAFIIGSSWHCTVFFDTSAMLISVVLLGRLMEHTTKGKTSEALTKLMTLQPENALLVQVEKSGDNKGTEVDVDYRSLPVEEISLHLVQMGDVLLVKRGSTFPVDGIVEFGETTVNQGMVTGESMPVFRSVGDHVIGGTTNEESNVYITSTCRSSSDSKLAQIVRLVQEAQGNKPPIQAVADYIASVFVPVVVGISILTFVVWIILLEVGVLRLRNHDNDNLLFAIMRAVSVLVISCPCSLGLATPTAIMVGTGVGASLGILYKSGTALELAGKTTAVVFDKTGTLTEANPRVVEHVIIKVPTSVGNRRTIWRFVEAVEQMSEHMLAKAIGAFARGKIEASVHKDERKLSEVQDFQAKTGFGVTARVSGVKVTIGSKRWIDENKITCESQARSSGEAMSDKGHVSVYVAIDTEVVAVLGLSDTLKPDSTALISWLRDNSIPSFMITGDTQKAAKHTALEVGIPTQNAMGDALPEDKIEFIRGLQAEGLHVLFIGDGINDAPALAQADVGVSVSRGTDIAMETAQVVLVKDESLMDLAAVIDLSKATLTRIKMNFGWALIYNMLSIPIAAGILYPSLGFLLPPVVAAFAMGCSSSSVVLSSLWLKRYEKPSLDQHRRIPTAYMPIEGEQVETAITILPPNRLGRNRLFGGHELNDKKAMFGV